MSDWIAAHGVGLLAAWYVFSAVVSGMPDPGPASSTGYQWAYRSLHVLAGDFSNFLKAGGRSGGPDAAR